MICQSTCKNPQSLDVLKAFFFFYHGKLPLPPFICGAYVYFLVCFAPTSRSDLMHHKGFGDEYTPVLFILYSLRCITKFHGDIGGLCVSGDESYSMEEMKIAQGLNSEGFGTENSQRPRHLGCKKIVLLDFLGLGGVGGHLTLKWPCKCEETEITSVCFK